MKKKRFVLNLCGDVLCLFILLKYVNVNVCGVKVYKTNQSFEASHHEPGKSVRHKTTKTTTTKTTIYLMYMNE